MKPMNLQDTFLNATRTENIPVTISLTNGFQFRGIVMGFDAFTVILEAEGKLSMIYKHAIASITPGKNIKLDCSEEE